MSMHDPGDSARRLRASAERALELMRAHGFEHAQASAARVVRHELNFNFNEPSLMRSTDVERLALSGLVDGRKASTELGEVEGGADLAERIAALHADARAAPQDAAHAVSAGERARIVQGPPEADLRLLADTVAEVLDVRAREAPKMMLEEGLAAHALLEAQTLTSGGSDLACRVGWYEASVMGTARDGQRASSFNHAGGRCHDLRGVPIVERFGIGAMLHDTQRQVDAQPIGASFTGDVVLMPQAVADVVGWLLGQLSDPALIARTSLYRERVGSPIGAPLLSLRSRFDAPGIAAISADAYATAPVEVLSGGRLCTLLPSLYGSRKTGLPHVPTPGGGWELDAGPTPRSEVIGGVPRGSLVGRLSMGHPASNGDFSGVIKNSFAIEHGEIAGALSETMISGNVAQMLKDVTAVSCERIDTGTLCLPWLRIGGLHFS
ncbi:MAG TPA: metallopeptidase TldD-related protein [Caldimonas sp.]|nr:metallopeptidase TldD-related protein [Caldimonas sp.]